MLTVNEINEVSFGKAGFSGYKPEDVDAFIDTVAESFKELQTEREGYSARVAELQARNSSLQEKLAILAEKIESYRKEEDGIKDALITAQVAAKNTVKDAEKKAEIILANADHQAQMTLSGADKESKRLMEDAREEAAQTARMYAEQIGAKKKELEEVKKQVTAFRNSLLEMYRKHLECIDHIPSFRTKETVENQSEVLGETQNAAEPIQETAPEQVAEPMQEISVSMPVSQPQANVEPRREQPVVQPQVQVAQQPKLTVEPTQPVAQPQPTMPLPSVQITSAQNKVNAQPVAAPVRSRPTYAASEKNSPMTQKVNYAQMQRASETAPLPMGTLPIFPYDEDDDLTGVGINTTTFSSIPESLLREKKTGYSNLEFGEGIDVTRK